MQNKTTKNWYRKSQLEKALEKWRSPGEHLINKKAQTQDMFGYEDFELVEPKSEEHDEEYDEEYDYEEDEITLWHGTLIDHKDSIGEIGLVPGIGKFVEEMYGGEDIDPSELLYLAKNEDFDNAVNAMVWQISKKLNKGHQSEITNEDIFNHGLLIRATGGSDMYVTNEDGSVETLDGDIYYDHGYLLGPETDDVFTEDVVYPDELYYGEKLMELLKDKRSSFIKSDSSNWYKTASNNGLMKKAQIIPEDESQQIDMDFWNAKYPPFTKTVGGLVTEGHVDNVDSISASLDHYEELPGIREISLEGWEYAPSYSASHNDASRKLAREIKESGWVSPLIVAVWKDGPYILEGAHRLDALQLLGDKSFPALVVLDLEHDMKTLEKNAMKDRTWMEGEDLRITERFRTQDPRDDDAKDFVLSMGDGLDYASVRLNPHQYYNEEIYYKKREELELKYKQKKAEKLQKEQDKLQQLLDEFEKSRREQESPVPGDLGMEQMDLFNEKKGWYKKAQNLLEYQSGDAKSILNEMLLRNPRFEEYTEEEQRQQYETVYIKKLQKAILSELGINISYLSIEDIPFLNENKELILLNEQVQNQKQFNNTIDLKQILGSQMEVSLSPEDQNTIERWNERNEYPNLIQWIQNVFYDSTKAPENVDLVYLRDYINANPTIDISKLTQEQLTKLSVKWHEDVLEYDLGEMSTDILRKEPNKAQGGETVQRVMIDETGFNAIPDNLKQSVLDNSQRGISVIELNTERDLKLEGQKMGHCVGGYGDHVSNKESEIYSFRNAEGESVATVEMQYNRREERYDIVQIKGIGNKVPIDKYRPFIMKWIIDNGLYIVGDVEGALVGDMFSNIIKPYENLAGLEDISEINLGEQTVYNKDFIDSKFNKKILLGQTKNIQFMKDIVEYGGYDLTSDFVKSNFNIPEEIQYLLLEQINSNSMSKFGDYLEFLAKNPSITPSTQEIIIQNGLISDLINTANNPALSEEFQSLKGLFNPQIKIEQNIIDLLIQNGDSSVLTKLSQRKFSALGGLNNINIPIDPDLQYLLMQNGDEGVIEDLTNNLSLSEDLQSLKGLRNPKIPIEESLQNIIFNNRHIDNKIYLSKNHGITSDIQNKLIEDNESRVLQNLARNRYIDIETQNKLVNNEALYVRERLAENENLTEENQNILSQDKDSHVLASLAGNLNLKEIPQKRIIRTGNGSVLQILAQNEVLSDENQASLFSWDDPGIRMGLLKNRKLSPEVQNSFFNIGNTNTLTYLSVNSNLHEGLKTLSGLFHLDPQLDIGLQQILSEPKYKEIWHDLIDNNFLHEDIQNKLIDTGYEGALISLSVRNDIPQDIQEKLFNTGNESVLKYLKMSQEFQNELFDRGMAYFSQGNNFVLKQLANNENISDEIANKLSELKDNDISITLSWNSGLPRPFKDKLYEKGTDLRKLYEEGSVMKNNWYKSAQIELQLQNRHGNGGVFSDDEAWIYNKWYEYVTEGTETAPWEEYRKRFAHINKTASPRMETLKNNKKTLTKEERQKVKECNGEWEDGDSAVFKSEIKGKTYFVTHTHRAYQVRDSIEGACKIFNDFIKSTAGNDNWYRQAYSNENAWLRDYLKIEFDPQRHEYEIIEYMKQHDLMHIFDRNTTQFIEMPDDEDIEYYEREQFENWIDKTSDKDIEELKNWLESNSDQYSAGYGTPHETMSYKGYVKPTWLIHFTDHADDISNNGFQYGHEDMEEGLALTPHTQNQPGYNFAFDVDSRYVSGGEGKYGDEAVIFWGDGVEAHHHGDDEDQIMFWGPSVDTRMIFPIVKSEGEWIVEHPNRDNPLYGTPPYYAGEPDESFNSPSLDDVIAWVMNNYRMLQGLHGKDKKGRKERAYASKSNWYKSAQAQPGTYGPVYHGSRTAGITSFDMGMVGKGVVGNGGSDSIKGFFFTSEYENALFYTDPQELENFDRFLTEDDWQIYGDGPYYVFLGDEESIGGFETEEEAQLAAMNAIEKNNQLVDANAQGIIFEQDSTDQVYTAMLTIKNPLIVEGGHPPSLARKAIQEGYDGVICKNVVDGQVPSDIYVVFSDEQIRLIYKKASNGGNWYKSAQELPVEQVEDPRAKFMEGAHPSLFEEGGKPITTYHGTTWQFDVFNGGMGNKEGHYGASNYFTNERMDAYTNYGAEGSDLEARIGQESEMVDRIFEEDGIEGVVDTYGIDIIRKIENDKGIKLIPNDDDDPYEFDLGEIDDEMSKEIAQSRLIGPNEEGIVMQVHIRLKNPIIKGLEEETYFDYEQEYDEESDEYGEESGGVIDLMEAIQSVAGEYVYVDGMGSSSDPNDMWSTISENLEYYEGFSVSEFEKVFRENFTTFRGDDDDDSDGEFLRKVYEEMGYDGIIMDANKAFGPQHIKGPYGGGGGFVTEGMPEMYEGVIHYLVFDPKAIKSSERSGYNPESENIYETEESQLTASEEFRMKIKNIKG